MVKDELIHIPLFDELVCYLCYRYFCTSTGRLFVIKTR